MKARPIDELVHECMFPPSKAKATDPQNFHALLQRSLVPEVRAETTSFYGDLDTKEAQYPGLDYSHPPHRRRLSRFTWHRRLFRAFDTLGLTKSEIAGLTKWEVSHFGKTILWRGVRQTKFLQGTIWAKKRYEAEQGIIIKDTTGDCIEDWVEPALRQPRAQPQVAEVEEMEAVEAEEDSDDMDEDEEDSEMEIESVGVELNERLRAAVAQREAGDTAAVLDSEWEEWLKDAVEGEGLPAYPPPNVPDGAFVMPGIPPRLLNRVRLGQLHPLLPEHLRAMARHRPTGVRSVPNERQPSPPTGNTIRRESREARESALDPARSLNPRGTTMQSPLATVVRTTSQQRVQAHVAAMSSAHRPGAFRRSPQISYGRQLSPPGPPQ